MKVYLIRHGETRGNREHRYVGRTDEGILPEAKRSLAGRKMPAVEKVYVSPMLRCLETARLLYPGMETEAVEAFRECDFGAFEYLSYVQLNGNPDFQRFIDTGGKSGFPGGEDRDTFQKRCADAFDRLMVEELKRDRDIALVVHGGTIMAILDKYSAPHKEYYQWQVKNGVCLAGTVERCGDRKGFRLTQIRELGEAIRGQV